jgi:uncharacterized protein (TIGR03083 family)
MDPVDVYRTSRRRLAELAPTLTEQQLALPLPATPPWTVADGYRHLTGVCADVLDGAMDGAGSPAWTAAQIEARRDASIAEVCAEWEERAPALEAMVESSGRAMSFTAFDAWTHEQDIRAAVGLGGARDGVADGLASLAVTTLAGRYAGTGAPTLQVELGDDTATLGTAESSVTLRTTPYELLRAIFGRRSRQQLEALDWSDSDDAAAVIEALPIFPLPEVDIVD